MRSRMTGVLSCVLWLLTSALVACGVPSDPPALPPSVAAEMTAQAGRPMSAPATSIGVPLTSVPPTVTAAPPTTAPPPSPAPALTEPTEGRPQIASPLVLEPVGQGGGYARAVEISGSLAYVIGSELAPPYEPHGLIVLDTSDPAHPVVRASLRSLLGNDLQVVDRLAYVVGQGLTILDVSDPANPAPRASYDMPGIAISVEVVDQRAYVMVQGQDKDHFGTLAIFDVRNPDRPSLLGTFATPSAGAAAVQVVANLAYVIDSLTGLLIVDIGDPTNPQLRGSFATQTLARSISVVDSRAYIATDGGFEIVDLHDLERPTLLGSYQAQYSSGQLQVVDEYAYIAYGDYGSSSSGGVAVVDVRDPARPRLLGSYTSDNYVTDLEVADGLVYSADNGRGLVILRALTAAASPVTPIVDGKTNLLLGGAQNGRWLDAVATAPLLTGGEQYELYADAIQLGTAIGSKPVVQIGGPCDGTQVVTLRPQPQRVPSLAVASDWDVLARVPEDLSPQAEVYRAAIDELLRANGITWPKVQLTRVQRIDLEGDGVDEVLITAMRLAHGTQAPAVAAGDYSLIVLRKLSHGNVVTIPLAADYYPQAQEPAYPHAYTIAAVLDLNGDGRQEIVVESARYEGGTMSLYEVSGTAVQRVLNVGCSE